MDAVAPTAMDGVVVPTSAPAEARTPEAAADEYRRGTLTVGFITLLFASNSPALHAALTSMEHAPPPLMLNALCGIAALVGLLWGGPLLGQSTALPSTLELLQRRSAARFERTLSVLVPPHQQMMADLVSEVAISPYLPYISLYLPTSPYISLHLPGAWAVVGVDERHPAALEVDRTIHG